MNKVESFEQACSLLGIGTELPDVSMMPEKDRESIHSFYKLTIIIRATNLRPDGTSWEPDWLDATQRKWYNWFWVEEVDGNAGLGCSHTNSTATLAPANLGSRLCFETMEQAVYVRETFKGLYAKYLL
ncbi:MAG: hypothetical protein VB022_10895 [Rikenellaceae bacterium]|nr:hypothetical protein [Rikenellaceae bacterium]